MAGCDEVGRGCLAGPVVAAGVGLLAALVSCALPPLLQPATAAAASAIAPMASFFLIVCSPSGPADLPLSADVFRVPTLAAKAQRVTSV